MSVYTGLNNAFMQTKYVDQQATALPGDLAYASDVTLIDAAVVAMPSGSEKELLAAGLGVVSAYSAKASRPGMNSTTVSPVSSTTTAATFYGITIRNQQCQTDENGVSGWGDGRLCNVMRADRVGGRVWVKAVNAATAGKPAYLVIQDTTEHGFPIGSFAGSEIKDTTTDTVAMTNVKWVTSAAAGELGLVEII